MTKISNEMFQILEYQMVDRIDSFFFSGSNIKQTGPHHEVDPQLSPTMGMSYHSTTRWFGESLTSEKFQ